MTAGVWRSTTIRWLKFNLVGGIGIAVQLLVLALLKTGLHFNYLIATDGFARFLTFNLTTGLFSVAGNLALMKLLVGVEHLNYLLANGITITACSVVNFLVSDGFVFAEGRREIQST